MSTELIAEINDGSLACSTLSVKIDKPLSPQLLSRLVDAVRLSSSREAAPRPTHIKLINDGLVVADETAMIPPSEAVSIFELLRAVALSLHSQSEISSIKPDDSSS